MIIIGVDPGSRITGYGIIEVIDNKPFYLSSGCIQLSGDFAVRLSQLYEALLQVVKEYSPTVCAIESVFVHKNPNSALKLGQARGVILLALNQFVSIPFEYEPRLVKKTIVGTGSAIKSQVQFMVQKKLNLSGTPKEDAADALAVALCHVQKCNSICF